MDAAGQLKVELDSLHAASREYDEGQPESITRIAASLKAIFHTSGTTRSLLAQLGKWHINLLSTCTKNPAQRPYRYLPGLVHWELDARSSLLMCVPKLDSTKRTHRFVQVGYWWESEAAYLLDHVKVRRSDLVLHAAHKAAEMPADETLPAEHRGLLDSPVWRATVRTANAPEREVDVYNGPLATLRQIGYEALNSPDLRKLASL